MAEYWLVSAPGEKTQQQTYEALKSRMVGMSPVYKFPIPELKVGTLDTLVGLSDDLNKVDSFVESTTRKLAHYMVDVLEEHQDRVKENLLANGHELSNYVTKFQWDSAKYPIKQSLRNLTEIISKQVSQIEHDLKTKSAAYNNIKGTLASLERKSTGSLLTRNLGELVKKEHFVLDSEYLTTLLVVVPKALFNEWKEKYWKLTDMVVPESSKLLFEDNEHGLFTVTLFKKVLEEFKHHARDNKFLVRDFVYDEQALSAGKNEISKLESDRKRQFGPLVRWLRVNFSDSFTAWIHIKALRVFVESVLRYGLPVNFQAMLLEPSKKTQKKIRDSLDTAYSYLESKSFSATVNEQAIDIPGLMISHQQYYPYVFYNIKLNLLER
ncbi:V-type proton ATPase subunit C [Nematostella vectensis]|uniref:V-type proton ATPase subunit C n=1 Tax=Nematostella vectensis TaxID=45351 RepID=UPI0013904FF8|nr:V-type proton ATPase subunit C [Nematostella vectensis]